MSAIWKPGELRVKIVFADGEDHEYDVEEVRIWAPITMSSDHGQLVISAAAEEES